MDGVRGTGNRLLTCLGLLLFAGLLVGAGYAAYFVYQAFSGSRPEIAAAIITGAFTVIVAVTAVMIGRWAEAAGQIEKELREKKAPAYDKLMQFMLRVLFAGKAGGKPVTEKEVIKTLSEFTQEVMVWGADEVLASWVSFRRESLKPDNSFQMLTAYEDLVLAIRKDLGHANRGIRRGDILRLFVNDIDTVLAGGAADALANATLVPLAPVDSTLSEREKPRDSARDPAS